MRRWVVVSSAGAAVAASIAVLAVVRVEGQGRPAAPAPTRTQAYTPRRTTDGQPDLQGVWRVWNLAKYDIEDHSAYAGVPAGKGVVEGGQLPYLPAALAKRNENFKNSRTTDPLKSADPLAKCYIPGVPRVNYTGWPLQIVQTSRYVEIMYEWMHERRFIYFDPKGRMQRVDFWNGDSRGHWEGNSLVVDVANFNDRTWFDMAGNFHSDALHVTERYTLAGPDTLTYEATIEDPKVFTRPWKTTMPMQRQKEVGLLEYECQAMLEEAGYELTWPRE